MPDTAVLVTDMMNNYRHPDAEQLAASAATVIDPLADLIRRARRHDDVTVIYVNDNYGDFTAVWDDIVRDAREGAHPELVEPILPTKDCLRLNKVRHSAFYATPLDHLLKQLGVHRLILTGQVTEQCVLYTALDAYVRHYDVVVPPDAVAHIDSALAEAACEMMRRNMRAELIAARDCLADS
ncbi:cysteine hydrolase family protein [Mycolicibacterium bacteremicum]|uniref:Isochorismatase n=1 Tax=Mycolicibacterium bacteremicum TaxID=564198 RepID=A0A1W9YZI6_MYCBA|nr:isochorismatase family cysteine hydrolase [Mycolicibacterium bacteremicum]MCV7435266.1 cysteine hydrolase [Mycolicibacterium bacteremicum]ORA05476.1 isochorismatase [Mycolicibacterium bacteremicum]